MTSLAVHAAPPILVTNTEARLIDALAYMNMTKADLAFEKDVVEPRLFLERSRRFLQDPLALTRFADETRRVAETGDDGDLWALFADWLESTSQPLLRRGYGEARGMEEGAVPVGLRDAVKVFVKRAQKARELLDVALGGVSPGERRYLAAGHFAGLFRAEDRAEVRELLPAIGVTTGDVARAIEEFLEIDPEPSAERYLSLLENVDVGALLLAGEVFQGAVSELAAVAGGVSNWPSQPVMAETSAGCIVVGTPGADVYEESALLLLDPGGDDLYRVGAANGLSGNPLCGVIDLGGDDRYAGSGLIGSGAALFGVSVILDANGNDHYGAAYAGQASAFFGMAWLEDSAGDDIYRARGFAQAAADVGAALLADGGGNDVFEVGFCGQGYAGVLGGALLVDRGGNDRYFAGGREHDFERNDDRYISLAQGFGIGMRPYAGGGVAALVDLGGNDTYVADVFGQGVSYWYSVGMLLDAGGEDSYSLYQYGQGTGIHLSSGLLADGGGRDVYTGHSLAQGSAHDYAVGMLFDAGGDADKYTSDDHSQGRAINNSLAILMDDGGDDAYFARQPGRCQGVGNDGDKREYGSLALLLDLRGADVYSCGATNGARMLRPNFGIVYDVRKEVVE